MYVEPNYKTKKELKCALENGALVTVYQPNGDLTGTSAPSDGVAYVEGPHYPKPHKWYAKVRVENGRVTKVMG